jgi:3,4-dehydroadipyl-CoA semialdehyde dehydrogenase
VNVQLRSLVAGTWIPGAGPPEILVDPVRGTAVAEASARGVDFGLLLQGARDAGGALRALGYAARAALLGKTAELLAQHRTRYLDIALQNSGSPEADASMDIDGALFTLKYFARAGAALGSGTYLTDGAKVGLSKDGSFDAGHLALPLQGAALHINAFNFPAWGMWEKAAASLLAGVPVVTKPATSTAWLAYEMIKDLVDAAIWPAGAISIICGRAGDLLDHLTSHDVVAFTGSAATAATLRTHPRIISESVRLNIEADSVNSALLGPDVSAASPEFELFVKEVAREMTFKAGQKCTAIRRAMVPAALLPAVTDALVARLAKTSVGDPRNKSVRMGPLVNKAQQTAASAGIEQLGKDARRVFGGTRETQLVDADFDHGAFVPPTLFVSDNPASARVAHTLEVFGPVATLMPYADFAQGLAFAARGQGSLVASVFSGDGQVLDTAALSLGTTHGRVLLVDASVGATQTGHGNVMPQSLHGGPGRAGGGEELGGLRALAFYHRRTALQGPTARITALCARGATVSY